MRLLVDENVPIAAVRALRIAGHDVFSASESDAGASDDVLLTRANEDERLLITFDRDFGDLAVRQHLGAAGGIVLLRFVPSSPEEVATLLGDLLARPNMQWSRRLSVVDRKHVRQRLL